MPHGRGERRAQVERGVEIGEPVSAGLSAAARGVDNQRRDEAHALLAGLEKTCFFKPSPVVFLFFLGFGGLLGFLGSLVFFGVFGFLFFFGFFFGFFCFFLFLGFSGFFYIYLPRRESF